MKAKILDLMMRHTVFLDAVSLLTKRIYNASFVGNLELAIFEIQNRERLINILSKLQERIETQIQSLGDNDEDHSAPFVELLHTWEKDLSLWFQKTNEINQEILELFERQKEQTTQEIATLFKVKEQFKGYNLNNVRK